MKKFIAIFLCFVILIATTVTAYAKDVELFSNNVDTTSTVFSISSNGLANVKNTYFGITGTTKSAEIVTKVQKKVGLIWVTVSGGSWTDTSTATDFSKSHSVQLSSKGTYRAHVVFTISGTGGSNDKITKNVEKEYA
ncbi:MAG: hypothetical protein ACI4RR_02640 [Eubacterium sp.]